jgi:hypothetical protein
MNPNLVLANKIQTIYKYIYLHTFFFQCQWAISMEATLTYKNVALKIHGCHKPHGTSQKMGISSPKNDLCPKITPYSN